jgi:hypothetical protein
MSKKYVIEDVIKSFQWLGHKSVTELNAYHLDYRPGPENFEHNLKHKAFPRIWYTRKKEELVNFVLKYHSSRICCYSLNPRKRILKNDKGYPQSAKESEIEVSQNLLLDFDFVGREVRKERVADFELFLQKADEYFLNLGLQPPVRAFTGRGYHLLFPYPEIKVSECPDIKSRLRNFCEQFYNAYRQELERLEVKLDKTQDLRRMVKIYGTAKPDVGIISRFYGGERVEDEALRDYLLRMEVAQPHLGGLTLMSAEGLPRWFSSLLEIDSRLNELWSGRGKSDGTDMSRTGFDYSLIKRLLNLGYRNIDDLCTILALRPEGAVQKSGKGRQYVLKTIANALTK